MDQLTAPSGPAADGADAAAPDPAMAVSPDTVAVMAPPARQAPETVRLYAAGGAAHHPVRQGLYVIGGILVGIQGFSTTHSKRGKTPGKLGIVLTLAIEKA